MISELKKTTEQKMDKSVVGASSLIWPRCAPDARTRVCSIM